MTATTFGRVDAIDRHVDALAAAVRGPRRLRHSMLREVHDGLTDAADAHVDGGRAAAEAATLAVAEFGTVDELAGHYQAELTARQGRGAALLVAVLFPATVLAWDVLWRGGVSWGPVPSADTAHTIRALAGSIDTSCLLFAVAGLALYGLTYLRVVPPRLITALAGVAAGLGGLTTAGLSVAMNVIGSEAAGGAIQQGGVALPAYLTSAAVMVTVLISAARSVRTALA